jgi:tRNA dimethylallyltransferase
MTRTPPLIVILGPTSSGKSALGIKLARKFKGEIISADSRQVYTGMDLGTGKVTKAEQRMVRHHLLDVAAPKKQYTVSEFQTSAQDVIGKVTDAGKIPFLVGGTPFYIYSVVDNLKFPEVAPNLKLRAQLEKKSATELLKILKKLDPRRAATIEQKNPRRLIRAIEIVKSTGSPVPPLTSLTPPTYLTPLLLGISIPLPKLYKLIDQRLEKRLKGGMLRETKSLLKQKKVTHKRLQEMGLEYRFASDYLRGKINYDEMVVLMKNANHKFAKRQMTWFKTDNRIKWITSQTQAEKLVRNFLKTKRP